MVRRILTPKTTTSSKYGGYSGIPKAFAGTETMGTPKKHRSLKFVVDFGLSSVLLTESIILISLGVTSLIIVWVPDYRDAGRGGGCSAVEGSCELTE